MIDFDNTEVAFKYRTSSELKKAYYMFKMLGYPWLVRLGKKTLIPAIEIGLPLQGLVKITVFKQFCGGETAEESNEVIDRIKGYGVKAILDYSVEGNENEKEFEKTTTKLLKTVKMAETQKAIPFAVFKVTGVCRHELLEKKSRNEPLNYEEEQEWTRVRQRVLRICEAGAKNDFPVMIDAEESWIQGGIDELCEEMMARFNKEKPLVYNTVQMYRHDRLNYLMDLHIRAQQEKYLLGIKVVRGAYMEKERERAALMGYPSPIQLDKAASDHDYDKAIEFIVDHLDQIHLVAGTHNEASSIHLVNIMNTKGIAPDDGRIYFSQLYGMSDNLSFNLANAGYNVVKYLPFGPVKEVLPYLIRRAEENTSVKGQTGRELALIEKELKRRRG
ncbi:MAG: proline dehydrogenase family protein [Cryomorphaceae bacterium]|nr:proline dehydrogenase family protein [Cryomorphaceae bacterium]